MSNGTLLSILHVSDFHFTRRRAREQKIIVDALVADLETLCIGHRKPDLIIFTGDLVNRLIPLTQVHLYVVGAAHEAGRRFCEDCSA